MINDEAEGKGLKISWKCHDWDQEHSLKSIMGTSQNKFMEKVCVTLFENVTWRDELKLTIISNKHTEISCDSMLINDPFPCTMNRIGCK